jgi:diguanylate cyclase (GGDEF)-like protein
MLVPSPNPAPSLSKDVSAPPIWARPDPALADAGIEGESVVATVRVLAMALLLIAPTWNLLHHPEQSIHITGFAVTLAAGLVAVFIRWWLSSGRWRPWVGFATSAFDVSMVTLALISFLIVESPMVALNSSVTFEMYFLALVATSLRYDARICVAVGLLTIGEYGALWAYSATHYDLTNPAFVLRAGPYIPVDLSTRLVLLAVATLLSVMIVRRAQRLLYLASHDRLTGLFNRAHFDRALGSILQSASRDHQPLALAIIDVDHFKQINDAYGHTLGDRALRLVAEMLADDMRRTDLVARYGGEEFVIILPGTTLEAAVTRIDALREMVSSTVLDLGDGRTVSLAFSAGVAGVPADEEAIDPRTLLEVADRRLLVAKRMGRGRCIGADQPTVAVAAT